MKLALVQGKFNSTTGVVVKVVDTVEALLELPFHFNVNWAPPRVYHVRDEVCSDEHGAALMQEISELTRQRKFKVLRVPL